MEKVRDRMRRATQALEQTKIPYTVAGGNAVAALVAEVDEAAVRNTQDVDILIRREDLERVKEALGKKGFIYRHAASIDMFLDGHGAKARDAVHIVFAGEKIGEDDILPAPGVDESWKWVRSHLSDVSFRDFKVAFHNAAKAQSLQEVDGEGRT